MRTAHTRTTLLTLLLGALFGLWHASAKDPQAVTLRIIQPGTPVSPGAGVATRLPPDRETVVLIHGLCRSWRAMAPLAQSLAGEGYTVVNCDYPSRTADIPALTSGLFDALAPTLGSARRVHFVTHSMGGVLVRAFLREHALHNLGRVVMLGPPNAGSEVVDRLGALAPFGWINGPAGLQLGTGGDSAPCRLGPADFDLGVISGDRSVNPLLSLLIPGRDDGKVAVARTKVAGMRDFLCLHVTHPLMARNRRVIQQVSYYLRTGSFQHTEVPS
jgi:pimeloyl-ACP methyl ester carboxylesterase